MCQLGTCPSSVVCRSWLDVASAFAFLSQTCTRQSELAAREAGGERASVEQSMRIWFKMVIVLHLSSEFLHDAPHCSALIWFACLLFVFFSERFPFICRAGLCWAAFLCTGTVFGAPRAENQNAKLRPKLASCWRPKLS